jgi:hypothetical protein
MGIMPSYVFDLMNGTLGNILALFQSVAAVGG